VTAARGIIGQPKQLLVSEASNLFDLVCSEIAAVQGAIPIVLLQHTIAPEGLKEEWDRRTGPPIPRPKLWVRSQAALGSVCHRGFEERSRFRFVRSLDQLLELLKSVKSAPPGEDLRPQIGQRGPVVSQLRPSLPQSLACRCHLVRCKKRTSRRQRIADLACHSRKPARLRLYDV